MRVGRCGVALARAPSAYDAAAFKAAAAGATAASVAADAKGKRAFGVTKAAGGGEGAVAASGWMEHYSTAKQKPFWKNAATGELTWQRPQKAAAEGAEAEAPSPQLPAGWAAAQTEDGSTFFYCESSGETRWEAPSSALDEVGGSAAPAAAAADDLPDGWARAAAEDGSEYYYNAATGASSWERPA